MAFAGNLPKRVKATIQTPLHQTAATAPTGGVETIIVIVDAAIFIVVIIS